MSGSIWFYIGATPYAQFGHIPLFMQYAGATPRRPQPETGRIYQINNHGTIG